MGRTNRDRLLRRIGGTMAAADMRIGCGPMLGASPGMRAVWDVLERVAETETTVLVTGETGTGKGLFARTLHDRSRRREGRFVAINCGAVAESMMEAELFGHAAGAFTGATEARRGLLETANGGTLFLDEIGAMPVGSQAALLQALDERRVRPVGQTVEVPFDARVIAATNGDIDAALRARRLRADLFFRLAGLCVELPPLRSRGSDILLLAQAFLVEVAQRTGKPVIPLSPAAQAMLAAHPWPGNVRELRHCIESAVILAGGDEVSAADLRFASRPPAGLPDQEQRGTSTAWQIARRETIGALDRTGGNRTLAARLLQTTRRTIQRRIRRFGLPAGEDEEGAT